VVLFYFQKSPKLPKTEGQVGAAKETDNKKKRKCRSAAGEKPGDQEEQGSEADRNGAYFVRESGPPMLTQRFEGQRASEPAPMGVGGISCER